MQDVGVAFTPLINILRTHMAYVKNPPGKLIKPSQDAVVKAIWNSNKGKVYLNSTGTKTVYYPDGSSCHYPGN
jgi:hypothetical protein